MGIQVEKDAKVRERLMALGYALRKQIRIYGEDFELTSNPIPEEKGFAIEAISRKSGTARRLHIPLMTVKMIAKDLEVAGFRRAA